MQHLNTWMAAALMLSGSRACFAADTGGIPRPGQPDADKMIVPNPAYIKDGQIALTAKCRFDGTWDVTAGPEGEALYTGLTRDAALNIVGAPTGPYKPKNEDEAKAADLRLEAEQKLVNDSADAQLVEDDEPDESKGEFARREVELPTAQPRSTKKASKAKAAPEDKRPGKTTATNAGQGREGNGGGAS